MEKQEALPTDSIQQNGDSDQKNPDKEEKEEEENVESDSTTDNLPSGFQEVAKSLPQEQRTKFIREVSRSFGLMMSMPGGRPADPEFLRQQDEHQYQVAVKGIDAQQTDRRESRAVDLVKFKITAGIVAGVILVVAIFSGIAMYKDKTDFILELMKVIGYIVGGLGGGALIFRPKK